MNCVGVMGAGLALEFKARWPLMFAEYRRECIEGRVELGRMSVYRTGRKIIINFPTKRHWRDKSQIGFIARGLTDLIRVVRDREISSIAIPKLGCGLGGLEWKSVRPMIADAFDKGARDVDVRIYGTS